MFTEKLIDVELNYIIGNVHHVSTYDFIFLLFGDTLGLLLAVYVDRDANILLKDAETMEGSKYSFKEI